MLSVLAVLAAGIAAGFVLRRRFRLFSVLDPATTWIIRILLFLLGHGIGADAELLSRIPTLGLQGFVLAVAAIAGSVLAARFLMGRDSLGTTLGGASSARGAPALQSTALPDGSRPPGVASTVHDSPDNRWKTIRGSLAALAAFVLGLPAGILLPDAAGLDFDPAGFVLRILMFLVGVGAGADPTAFTMMKKHGRRMLVLPLAVILGTFAGCLTAALAWPALPIRETLAVGAGFGYYSLSSLIIRDLSGGDWAAVALLSNIAREILTLLSAPLLVRLAGPAAPAAAGGATSMDTTLAVIVQNSGRAWAVPALFSGIVLTLLTPVAVTLVLTV